MFDGLSDRLGSIFDKLRKRGVLSESDLSESLREIRRALLEADVSLEVARQFVQDVQEKAVGARVLASLKPGQLVVKLVHDALVAVLGSEKAPLDLSGAPPAVVLMAGLQGSGKTTTAAKLAKWLKDRKKSKTLLASLDIYRPAAMQQLAFLGEQIGVETLPIVSGDSVQKITARAQEMAFKQGFDVLILDTAGRTTLDDVLMDEIAAVEKDVAPREILLVADSLTGQDAVKTAQAFASRIALTGVVLTRLDGDGRGGAALSMRMTTGKPVKFIGVGEKIDALEEFQPERMADRILGMGDVVSLVEKVTQEADQEQMQKVAQKLRAGVFDLADFRDQLKQMQKMGGVKGMLAMMPGMKGMGGASLPFDDSSVKRQIAIIDSMTPDERRRPEVLKHKRKVRIAAGSGTGAQDLNKLLKMHRQMADLIKKMRSQKQGLTSSLANFFGFGEKGQDASPLEALKSLESDPASPLSALRSSSALRGLSQDFGLFSRQGGSKGKK